METLKTERGDQICIVLVGCKVDLLDRWTPAAPPPSGPQRLTHARPHRNARQGRSVNPDAVRAYATGQGAQYFETSAKTGLAVEDPFVCAARAALSSAAVPPSSPRPNMLTLSVEAEPKKKQCPCG